MKCEICGKEILRDSQCINYKYYHNDCIEHLLQENKILKENAENNDKVVDKVNWENMLLKKENKQLKDNWNKLKEYTQEKYDNPSWASCGARYVLEKMQELEQGKDE